MPSLALPYLHLCTFWKLLWWGATCLHLLWCSCNYNILMFLLFRRWQCACYICLKSQVSAASVRSGFVVRVNRKTVPVSGFEVAHTFGFSKCRWNKMNCSWMRFENSLHWGATCLIPCNLKLKLMLTPSVIFSVEKYKLLHCFVYHGFWLTLIILQSLISNNTEKELLANI